MLDFFTSQEGIRKKIILIVVLFLLAAVIIIVNLRNGTSSADTKIALKCRACGHAVTMTQEQFEEMNHRENEIYIESVAEQNPQQAEKLRQLLNNPTQHSDPMDRRQMEVMLPSWGIRNWPFACPKCNEYKYYIAIICPECGEIFFGENESGQAVRICPKCKYNLKSKK